MEYKKEVINCDHWTDCNIIGGGCCDIEKFVVQPSYGLCIKVCGLNGTTARDNQHKESQGLGDTIKKMIDKATLGKVKPCGGCKKRQAALNKMMPYKGDKDAN
tara:strand:+ start:1026 stop:1334 length:309 start_codon:yes stop_codon:yes gene_type:complete